MQHQATSRHSLRPPTPESPCGSLYNTIDDLTTALTKCSQVPVPEPEYLATCCCGLPECANTKSWLAFKAELESRLILCAEVGQALLQKHEASVRQHENAQAWSHDAFITQLHQLRNENTGLEKRLKQALVDAEVAEIANQTTQRELQNAQTTISRLTAHHARSVGWDTRLSTAMKERDDLQQERDSETQRAKLAESRVSVLKDRLAKVQQEVHRLQEDLDQRRAHRLQSSESLLQDARARIDSLQHTLGQTAQIEQAELTRVLESLVDDNEVLKRDNLELQGLLANNREEVHQLREELEEQKASQDSIPTGPNDSFSLHVGSLPISPVRERIHRFKRNASLEQKSRRPFEPLTPETSQQPLSPIEMSDPPDMKPSSFISTSSQILLESVDAIPERHREHKSLYLLTRSRGVQTDTWHGSLTPSPFPSYLSSPSPNDTRSESSSISESQGGHMTYLLDRLASIVTRIIQADALTLTNRLKRQHLRGADVGHLSRTTVSNIISEVSNLRTQFRALLEDDKTLLQCTRKDLRTFFKVIKDVFAEMGSMRVTLNDIILDPSIAPRVRELALDPTKGEVDKEAIKARDAESSSGWIAPLSKLFSSTSPRTEPGGMASNQPGGITRAPLRVIPKLSPALSASTTTVNVEFSGTGVGRSVTSTFSAHPTIKGDSFKDAGPSSSTGVMDIFAGAPRNQPTDPWVVIPKGPRRMQSSIMPDAYATLTRKGGANVNRLPRNVDAVIDTTSPGQDGDEERDEVGPLLERTLRRRGLSDSSLHSTFMSQEDSVNPTAQDAQVPQTERGSVFQAISRRVQSLRLGPYVTSGIESPLPSSVGTPEAHSTPPSTSPTKKSRQSGTPQTVAPTSLSGLLPHLSVWSTSGHVPDPPSTDPFEIGSYREESLMHRRHLPG